MKMLSHDINHIIVNQGLFLLGVWEIEKQFFPIYFLIQDISLNNTFRNMEF